MDKKYYPNDVPKPKYNTNLLKNVIIYQIKISEKYNENNIIIEPPKSRLVKFD